MKTEFLPMQMFPVPTDSARDFHKLGSKFLKAARIIFEKNFPELDFPAFALAGQAIELFLKAYLLTKGLHVGELKKIGHDLKSAFEIAEKHGLSQILKIEANERDALEKLSLVYQSKDFHYKSQGSWMPPMPDWTIDFGERLSQKISQLC
jgi:HEPN domain-containing protein